MIPQGGMGCKGIMQVLFYPLYTEYSEFGIRRIEHIFFLFYFKYVYTGWPVQLYTVQPQGPVKTWE